MNLYDVNGNELDAGGKTIRRNNPELVEQLLTVARSYLGKSGISYKDGQTILDNSANLDGIDCSTFAALCLMGYPFEVSPYGTGQAVSPSAIEARTSVFPWAITPRKYKASTYIDGSDLQPIRWAAQMARWMSERGQAVPLGNGFEDVRPGDVVFWNAKRKSTDEWVHPTWFEHIYHVGFVLSKEAAPATYQYTDSSGSTKTGTWDKAKYPYKHTIIEVINGTPPATTAHWLEEGQEDPTNVYGHNVNTIAMICRPDLGALV